MTAEKINETGLIDDNTEIVIREGEGFGTLVRGTWCDHEVESFTWQDDNQIYIDVKA